MIITQDEESYYHFRVLIGPLIDRQELKIWLHDNIKYFEVKENPLGSVITFYYLEDATAFKLRWI